MKRIINARVPVMFACALVFGVLTGYFVSYFKTNIICLIAVVPLTAIIFLPCIVFKKKKLLVITLIIAALFSGGALSSYYTLQRYSVRDVDTEKIYLISGKVTEKGATASGEYIIIDDATAYDTELSGKVRVYLDEIYGDFCDVGYSVKFYTKLKFNDTFPNGTLNFYAEDNVKYTCSPYSMLTSTYHFSLFGSIRNGIKGVLYNNLSYDTASVCYGMLLGDTQNLDDEVLDNFRYGGVAHIFAVSGLHIGLLYGVLTFILKKLRANKYVSFAIRIIIIVFYAGVCGFSISSLRAVIMCAANMLTKLFNIKSDGLNNLAFAVLFILLISPLNLFSVGFQLSVCAIAGITMLSGNVRRLLRKLKIPNKLAAGIGTSIGAQAGTLPVMLTSFGYLSGAGLLLNLLVIPIVSILFTVLFAGTVFSLIIPPAAGVVMQYAALPLEALLSFLLSANFEDAIITGFGAGVFIPIYFILFFILSDKINLKVVSRSALTTCVIAVLAVCVLAQTYSPVNGYKVTVSSYNNGGSALLKSPHGNVLVMTEYASVYQMNKNLNKLYAYDLDGVIIIGGNDCVESYDLSLGCNDVFISSLNIPVQPYTTVEIHYEKEFTLCGIDFEYIDGHNLTANVDGVKILFSDAEDLPFESCDILISLYENYDEVADLVHCKTEYTVYFNIPKTEYNAYDYGNLTFYIKNGEITL